MNISKYPCLGAALLLDETLLQLSTDFLEHKVSQGSPYLDSEGELQTVMQVVKSRLERLHLEEYYQINVP